MTVTPLRVLIVDDEPFARQRLRALLADDPGVAIVGECGNGVDAVAAIRRDAPDLVLLDVQMPELDGFGVVREVGVDAMPAVVFVTAYDEYALEAFEVHALDYLLKPVDAQRFADTVRRAAARVRDGGRSDVARELAALLEERQARRLQGERLAVKAGGRIFFLRSDQIDWVESVGNHVRLHVGKETHLLRETLGRLEQRLPGEKFLRIHRGAMINVDRIKEIQPWFHGDYVVVLTTGARITSGRSYRERLREFVDRLT